MRICWCQTVVNATKKIQQFVDFKLVKPFSQKYMSLHSAKIYVESESEVCSLWNTEFAQININLKGISLIQN